LVLLVRQVDVEADRKPSRLVRSAVRRLHQAGPTAGDDRETGLREASPHLYRLCDERVVLAHAGRPEDRDRRAIDPVDGFEALEKFVGDPGNLAREITAVAAFEQPTVFH